MQFLPPSRAANATHFGSANCPVAYHGLKIITSLALRFPDFQRMIIDKEKLFFIMTPKENMKEIKLRLTYFIP